MVVDGTARLRVALDATPLLGPTTGVGEFCLGALTGLGERADVDVSAFAVSWRRRGRMDPLLPAGVRAVRRPMPARPLHAMWSRTGYPPIEWFTGSVEIVHGTNYVVPPARRAVRVVTVHDLTTVRFPELCDPPSLAFPGFVRRAVREGAWVHTPSRFVADEVVEEWGVPAERVRAVHHGVPPSAGAPPEREVVPPAERRARSAGTPGPYLLCLGTIEPRKDLPTLVEAFGELAEEMPDLRLVIAGRDAWGSDALDAAIDAQAPDVRHRIERPGYVDPAGRSELLSHATVFVYPSLYEGFGFPPLEAMRAGVPVVATRGGAVPEVVGDAALLVEARHPAELAAALRKAATDGGLRAGLVAKGAERVRCFSWQACAEGLVGLYRDACAAGG